MKFVQPLDFALGAALIAAFIAPAQAHDDATLDAMASPHGGQLRMSGPYHFELVVGDNQLQVYVTDHAMQPTPVAGVSGSAIVLSGGKATIPLAVAGDNLVQGQGEFQPGPDMKVVVSLGFPDNNQWQARFTPWARMQGQAVGAPAAPQGMPMDMPMTMPMDHSGH